MTTEASGSAESLFGWSQLYWNLANWPDRIRDATGGPHRERDELEFYLCFFVQCYSLRDWMIQHDVMEKDEIDLAINSYGEMKICRDICNRFKHLRLRNPSIDAEWVIRRVACGSDDYRWAVFAGKVAFDLWDLMIQCLSFWEALVPAYGLEASEEPFVR